MCLRDRLCSFFSGYGAIADKLNEIASQKQ